MVGVEDKICGFWVVGVVGVGFLVSIWAWPVL